MQVSNLYNHKTSDVKIDVPVLLDLNLKDTAFDIYQLNKAVNNVKEKVSLSNEISVKQNKNLLSLKPRA